LIYEASGPAWLCAEIIREQSSSRSARLIRKVISAYLPPEDLVGKTILDFGCGSGSSTMNLARLFPASTITGTDIEAKFLAIAQARAAHYGYENVRFLASPAGTALPDGVPLSDFVFLVGVYEHLLPEERVRLLSQLWAVLKTGGTMFIFDTPNRTWPVQVHTTRLPLINFMPDRWAGFLARRLSKRVGRHDSWETLLRRGIRGGSVGELLAILRRNPGGRPNLLEPCRGECQDRIDLCWPNWRRFPFAKKSVIRTLKLLQATSGVAYVPDLELAIRKEAHGSSAPVVLDN
jgi:ubiquinone/menaquinone biosynthesis C-methylase UbiE